MNVRTLCLAVLNIQDATGYEIKKLSTDGPFQHFVEISFGSIYPALAKLESDALVTCSAQSQAGKPDRKVYSITATGRNEFIKSINVLPKQDKFISEFLLLAINADLASRDVLDAALDAQLAQYENELRLILEVLDECNQPAHVWTAEYGKSIIEAKINYLKNNRTQLLEMAESSALASAAQ